MNAEDRNILLVLVVAALVGILVGGVMGYGLGVTHERENAIKAGVGGYGGDPRNGGAEFRYYTPCYMKYGPAGEGAVER